MDGKQRLLPDGGVLVSARVSPRSTV
jgi:hypothetical protein